MARIWSDEARYERWLDIEIAFVEALERRGRAPAGTGETIRARTRIDAARILEIERTTKHDVIAFLTFVEEQAGPPARQVHLGLTSSDVLDTALALQLVAATDQIAEALEGLRAALVERAEEHRGTVMIGRSHGIHAEPVTFGLVLATFCAELSRHARRLAEAREEVRTGKLSGAVGTFASTDPALEEEALSALGLRPEPIATQVVPRDRHAHYFGVLAGIAASVERLAVTIRHLQRTEVLEAEEPFTVGQKGSSAMPHKRNPILSENLTGLSRLVRSYAGAALENVALWHERDISHSSVERVIAPDATILLDFMLFRATRLVKGLVVYPDKMRQNLEITGGLPFSQRVLLELVERGVDRQEAYVWVQRCAMASRSGTRTFEEELVGDPDVRAHLSEDEVRAAFDLARHLRHVDALFERALARPAESAR